MPPILTIFTADEEMWGVGSRHTYCCHLPTSSNNLTSQDSDTRPLIPNNAENAHPNYGSVNAGDRSTRSSSSFPSALFFVNIFFCFTLLFPIFQHLSLQATIDTDRAIIRHTHQVWAYERSQHKLELESWRHEREVERDSWHREQEGWEVEREFWHREREAERNSRRY